MKKYTSLGGAIALGSFLSLSKNVNAKRDPVELARYCEKYPWADRCEKYSDWAKVEAIKGRTRMTMKEFCQKNPSHEACNSHAAHSDVTSCDDKHSSPMPDMVRVPRSRVSFYESPNGIESHGTFSPAVQDRYDSHDHPHPKNAEKHRHSRSPDVKYI